LNRIWYQAANTHGRCFERDIEKPFGATNAWKHAKRITEAETASPGGDITEALSGWSMPQAEHYRRNHETRKPIPLRKKGESIEFVRLNSAGEHNEPEEPSYNMSQARVYSKRSTTRRGDRRNDSRWHIFVPPHIVYLKMSLPYYGAEIKSKIS